MLFTPQERRKMKDIILRRKGTSKEEAEVMVDSLFDLAIELDKIVRKHHLRRV
ncbi:hypothetical protein IPJ70_01225 [Candidatus Campbellbacteria bacterium]|nr:MAG: hypothetical protein IPJ70_01225 [Candidatus Campbellbacteria bacterium]